MAAVFRLSLGIGDIDSYAMLFYGHYPRYCERAATASLPAQSGAFFQLTSADLIKYSKSVGWNDVVDIRSTAVPPTKDASSDERAFLHEWICEGKTVHTCLATYRLVTAEPPTHDAPPTIAPAAAAPAAASSQEGSEVAAPEGQAERMLQLRVVALRRESSSLFEPPLASYRSQCFEVYADMLDAAGGLGLPTVLDYMERQRTEMIGGQAELERLQAEGVMIVVYAVHQLRLSHAAVRPRQTIEVSSGVEVQNEMFYCVHQRIRLRDGGPISEAHLKLVFVKDGAIGKAPAAVLRHIAEGGTLGTAASPTS